MAQGWAPQALRRPLTKRWYRGPSSPWFLPRACATRCPEPPLPTVFQAPPPTPWKRSHRRLRELLPGWKRRRFSGAGLAIDPPPRSPGNAPLKAPCYARQLSWVLHPSASSRAFCRQLSATKLSCTGRSCSRKIARLLSQAGPLQRTNKGGRGTTQRREASPSPVLKEPSCPTFIKGTRKSRTGLCCVELPLTPQGTLFCNKWVSDNSSPGFALGSQILPLSLVGGWALITDVA